MTRHEQVERAMIEMRKEDSRLEAAKCNLQTAKEIYNVAHRRWCRVSFKYLKLAGKKGGAK